MEYTCKSHEKMVAKTLSKLTKKNVRVKYMAKKYRVIPTFGHMWSTPLRQRGGVSISI